MRKPVGLLTSAWYGDNPLTLNFPAGWDIHLIGQAERRVLTDGEIREKIRNPMAAPSLLELVRGKKKVAVLIDDIQRPTPVKRIIPLVLEELKNGGIATDAITIVMATACHRPATEEDFIKKLGRDTVKNFKIVSHDCARDLTYLGRTKRGTPIYVNQFVAGCDVKIGISGVYPHESAGYGGGAKIIHPGICGRETARFLHSHLRGVARGSALDGEFRADVEEAAEKVGLDFTINIVLNGSRDISELFCGHGTIAHGEAVDAARYLHGVKPPADPDVIIANAYPFDTSLHFISKGLWPFAYGAKHSSKVVIAACPEGLGYHALSLASLPAPSRFLKQVRSLSRHDIYSLFSGSENEGSDFFLFSPNVKSRELKKIYKRAKLFKTWESLVQDLEARHRKSAVRVAVYPCAPLQIPSG